MRGIETLTARQRATRALEMLARSTTGNMGRSFDDCFEMGDGEAVVKAGLYSLSKSARYRAGVRRNRGVTLWVEYVDRYDREGPSTYLWRWGMTNAEAADVLMGPEEAPEPVLIEGACLACNGSGCEACGQTGRALQEVQGDEPEEGETPNLYPLGGGRW